jgi:Arc/MetJ family transcription regulator
MMRTNIDIDDALLAEAMRLTGAKTKKATVEHALRKVIELERRKSILELYGTVKWQGDLDAMRAGRHFPAERDA